MGATVRPLRRRQRVDVSIHAPVMGATKYYKGSAYYKLVSIHAPVMGATAVISLRKPRPVCFNSRARDGRDAVSVSSIIASSRFNSRARDGRDCIPD